MLRNRDTQRYEFLWFESGFLSISPGMPDYLLCVLSKCLYTVRLQRWYASKEYNYEIGFDIMISFTKLRTFRHSSFSIPTVT